MTEQEWFIWLLLTRKLLGDQWTKQGDQVIKEQMRINADQFGFTEDVNHLSCLWGDEY